MKQFVSVPVNGFLVWRISRAASLNHCLGQNKRHFSTVPSVRETQPEVLSKLVLDSKKQRNVHVEKRFYSNGQDVQESVALMDFEVWTTVNLFQILRDIYYFKFVLGPLDTFSLGEFIQCSGKALSVVTSLLSQLRFPELEGLLTSECKQQVEKNLQSWSKPELSALVVQDDCLIRSIPCDIVVFSDEKNEEKKFVEIRVIHYVWLEYCEKFGKTEITRHLDKLFLAEAKNKKWYMYAVYNSKFIKEVTKGSTDQWIINKINLKCFPSVFNTF